jgi:hypothetical protein
VTLTLGTSPRSETATESIAQGGSIEVTPASSGALADHTPTANEDDSSHEGSESKFSLLKVYE